MKGATGRTIREVSREVEIREMTDIIIYDGGSAGITAARMGMKIILVETYGFLEW